MEFITQEICDLILNCLYLQFDPKCVNMEESPTPSICSNYYSLACLHPQIQVLKAVFMAKIKTLPSDIMQSRHVIVLCELHS